MSTPKEEFLAGLKTIAPLFVGALPFGLITGLTAVSIGLTAVQSVVMSAAMFAGASQLAALELMRGEATIVVVLLTVFVVNLRHIMYAASIAPHFKQLPLAWRLLVPFFMADQPYALAIIRYTEEPEMRHKHWFFAGMGVSLWSTWTLATAAGVLLGAQIPPEWSLDFVIPLVFLVIVFPSIKDRPSAIAAVVAGIVAVIARPLPYNLGLMTAAVAGIAVGVVAENWLAKGQREIEIEEKAIHE